MRDQDSATRSLTDLATEILRVGHRLNDVIGQTEGIFLDIGQRLQVFSASSAEISKMSLAAARIMGGDEIRGSITGIREMVENLRVLFANTEAMSERNLLVLTETDNELKAAHEDLEALRDISRNLKMLGLSTKIQSTRTGRNMSTFMQLGNDISQMSGVISDKSEELISRATDLSGLVEDVFSNLWELKSRQEKQTVKMLAGAREIIESLGQISQKSAEESRRIAFWSDEIGKNLRDIIVSVQYQDITKQALEKVRKDLEAEVERVRESAATGAEQSGNGDHHVALVAAWNCNKQASCLKAAVENVLKALRTVLGSLEGIKVNIVDMSQVTTVASRESGRFLVQLERGMTSVTSFLAEVVESGREMSEAMNSLGATVQGMSAFTDDIEMISSDVELISLNARIKSAQTGSRGAGMGVIAGAVHKTAAESIRYRQSLLEKLENINRTAGCLKEGVRDSARREEKRLDHLVRELGVLLDALRIMQERIVSTLNSMEMKGRELSEGITRSVAEVDLSHRITQEAEAIALELEKAAERFLFHVPDHAYVRLSEGFLTKEEIPGISTQERLAMVDQYLPEPMKGECFSQTHADFEGTGEVLLFGEEA